MDATTTLQEDPGATTRSAPAPRAPRATPARHRLYKLLLAGIMFLVCGEIGSRIFWRYERGAPVFARDSLWYAYYPQLRKTGVEERTISNADATYDVLILGGSTVSEDFGTIGKDLGKGLEQQLGRPVRVYNLACAGHNSRDSMLKFRRLARQRFDLVVVYHGINDTRMNNAPPDKFQEDYSHCAWYKHLNFLEAHPRLCTFALPFTVLFTCDRIAEVTGLTWFTPRLNPRAELTQYGSDIRTRTPFRRNLEEILTAAKEKGTHVVLMSYAYHVPDGLDLDDPKGKHADYAGGQSILGLLGKPVNVIKGLEEHNAVIRGLAAAHPEATFVDQWKLMPRSGKIFFDCCHFTKEGCRPFVEHILTALAAEKGPATFSRNTP